MKSLSSECSKHMRFASIILSVPTELLKSCSCKARIGTGMSVSIGAESHLHLFHTLHKVYYIYEFRAPIHALCNGFLDCVVLKNTGAFPILVPLESTSLVLKSVQPMLILLFKPSRIYASHTPLHKSFSSCLACSSPHGMDQLDTRLQLCRWNALLAQRSPRLSSASLDSKIFVLALRLQDSQIHWFRISVHMS